MKILVFLALLGLHSAAAVTHSLKYFYTASSQVPNFPEFVVVGMVDDGQMIHYDSNTMKAVAKRDWMNTFSADNPQYLAGQTDIFVGSQQWFKGNIEIAKQRFNQTGGVHVFQWMYGCEWDDVTQDASGFMQYGYDGEDFIVFDLKTLTWIAPKQQAVVTKQKWDESKAQSARYKNYITQECVDWLKKYLDYGRSSLMRTERPSTHSLLQKTPSSPVSCFATGFYPNRAEMYWRKDGHQIHEDVERGEILPNHDGSFQMSVELDVSKVAPEDWGKYECVFQLSGVKDDITIKLDVIRSKGGFPLVVIGVVVGVILLLLVVGIAGYFLWKNKKGKEGFKPASTSDSGSDNSLPLNQKA
ncbi:H-2 class I histocompatibility antigen, Q9 alpha chain-like [Scomber japonicus]|uniref:H-2 class I histocompatibility antigen, Q9 alpha chain-like n=1 Tax=Scomber japonicus TaxID=13676 RepID=UPI00230588F3|nr:H-2 class I histocompatibility antigen, Q9 alpha chain-like [Scomber japonicus]